MYIHYMPSLMQQMKRWFAGKPGHSIVTVPAGRRIYAIGDIHGRDDLLREMHRRIAEDAGARGWANNILIYLGDYIDRAPGSREVLALAMGDQPHGFAKVCLRGNHEAALLDFLRHPENGGAWIAMGGNAALQSFGVSPPSEFAAPETMARAAAQLAKALTPAEHQFLHDLKYGHREVGYFFAHAGIRPGVDLEAQEEDDLIWIRAPFLESAADHGAVVVHGHSVRREVEVRPNRIGIDTGAYYTNRLTCLVLEVNKRWLLQTGATAGNPIAVEV